MKKFQKAIENCQAEIETEKAAIKNIEQEIEAKVKALSRKLIPHQERIKLLEETIKQLEDADTVMTVV